VTTDWPLSELKRLTAFLRVWEKTEESLHAPSVLRNMEASPLFFSTRALFVSFRFTGLIQTNICSPCAQLAAVLGFLRAY
jgi:hypothetical protein